MQSAGSTFIGPDLNKSHFISSFSVSDPNWLIISDSQQAVFVLVTDGELPRSMQWNTQWSREYLMPYAHNANKTEEMCNKSPNMKTL